MKPILSLSIMILFFISLSVQNEKNINNNKLIKVEEEIWSLEENYISYFGEANHKAILSFWHNKFLSCPD